MRTAGIDLATQPALTKICTIDWGPDVPVVSFVGDTTDGGLIEVCRTYDKVGIDCPFGWPEPFIEAITAHAARDRWPGRGQPPDEFRRELPRRDTDRFVHAELGITPLAVAADRIGSTAMRCALLLDALGEVDRTGITGPLAEVYPAATLKKWGRQHTGYKGPKNHEERGDILDELDLAFLSPVRAICVADDNAFDAMICALTARVVAVEGTYRPRSEEESRRAEIEGWIHFPKETTSPRDHLKAPPRG